MLSQKHSFNLTSILNVWTNSSLFKIIFKRKKPKIRKNPIVIKNNDINIKKQNQSNRSNAFQDNLALASENGFVLPAINYYKI